MICILVMGASLKLLTYSLVCDSRRLEIMQPLSLETELEQNLWSDQALCILENVSITLQQCIEDHIGM